MSGLMNEYDALLRWLRRHCKFHDAIIRSFNVEFGYDPRHGFREGGVYTLALFVPKEGLPDEYSVLKIKFLEASTVKVEYQASNLITVDCIEIVRLDRTSLASTKCQFALRVYGEEWLSADNLWKRHLLVEVWFSALKAK